MGTMWEALKEDWLLALVRFGRVAVGIMGAGIASPDAARAVGRTVRTYVVVRAGGASVRCYASRTIATSTWPTASARLIPSGGTQSDQPLPGPAELTLRPVPTTRKTHHGDTLITTP